MRSLLPALLAGLAVAVGLGLPTPRRLLVGGSATRLRRRVPASVLGVGVAGVALIPLGFVGAAVAGCLASLAQRGLESRKAARARTQERASASEAMSALAAELRAGRPPATALARAAQVAQGPTALALAEAAAVSGLGGAAAEVLARSAAATAVPDALSGLAVCWEVCSGAGSSLASAVDRLEQALRTESLERDEVEAELAGPRASAGLLAVLPVFGLLLGEMLGARPVHVLLDTTVGSVCLVLGVLLDLSGVWWTARIVASASGPR